jgi:hypothetical protein
MELISEQRARDFAQALIDNHGNATAAARSLEYDTPSANGHRLSRHPLVIKALAPMAAAQLQSLTPQAIQTLGHLLNNGSPYVRLEAAKDVLDRNGVGTSREPPRSAQLVVNINLSPADTAVTLPPLLDLAALPYEAPKAEGGPENSVPGNPSITPAHDFPQQVSSITLPHDFSAAALQPLVQALEAEASLQQDSLSNTSEDLLELRPELQEEQVKNIESRTKLEEDWGLDSE